MSQFSEFSKSELNFKKANYVFGRLIGKVAADNSHRWVHKEFSDPECNSSAWKRREDWVTYYDSCLLGY
jgi:hypothetical protein